MQNEVLNTYLPFGSLYPEDCCLNILEYPEEPSAAWNPFFLRTVIPRGTKLSKIQCKSQSHRRMIYPAVTLVVCVSLARRLALWKAD